MSPITIKPMQIGNSESKNFMQDKYKSDDDDLAQWSAEFGKVDSNAMLKLLADGESDIENDRYDPQVSFFDKMENFFGK